MPGIPDPEGPKTYKTVCEAVEAFKFQYWGTSPDIRPVAYSWLDEHALECDNCALAMENAAQELTKRIEDGPARDYRGQKKPLL